MKYTGIDLHSNNSVVTVIDETDKVVAQKRLPNDLAMILNYLEPHKAETAGVVVESNYNWYWLVDGLQEAGYTVHLANITAIKKYDGLKHSGDETDAKSGSFITAGHTSHRHYPATRASRCQGSGSQAHKPWSSSAGSTILNEKPGT